MKITAILLFLILSSYSYGQLLQPTQEETILSEYNWLFNDNGNMKCGPAENDIIETNVNQCQFIHTFEMFPNPTDSEVTIKFEGSEMQTAIVISDLQGKLIYSEKLDDFKGKYSKTITLSRDASGLLIVSIIQAKEVFTKKLMIK